LFDEPTTMLYQVWSLIRTLDDACRPDASISIESLLAQADKLVLDVVNALEGDKEVEIVRRLLRLRDSISRQQVGQELTDECEAARMEVKNIVNNFFYDKLTAIPVIKGYMDSFSAK
jgi:hypothetical protein